MRHLIVILALTACSSGQAPLKWTGVASYLEGDTKAQAGVEQALASLHPATACSVGCTVNVADTDAANARRTLRQKDIANVTVLE